MRYWSGTIAGTALEDGVGSVAGFDLQGAADFAYDVTGNTVASLNGTPQTQYADYDNGKVLTLSFIHIPQALLTTVLNALKATLPTGGSVACSFTDGYQTITGMFKPHVPAWYRRGNPDGAYVNGVELVLIKTGETP